MARRLLAEGSVVSGVELFSFRAVPSSKRCDIRLDKLQGERRPR